MIVCRMAERIRLEPALPITSSATPSRITTVGAIMLGSRRPGGWRWKPSGLRSCSPSMLLRWIPVPGTTTPEQEPLEQVTEHAQPSLSSTEMWVVDPSDGHPRPGERDPPRPGERVGPPRPGERAGGPPAPGAPSPLTLKDPRPPPAPDRPPPAKKRPPNPGS